MVTLVQIYNKITTLNYHWLDWIPQLRKLRKSYERAEAEKEHICGQTMDKFRISLKVQK